MQPGIKSQVPLFPHIHIFLWNTTKGKKKGRLKRKWTIQKDLLLIEELNMGKKGDSVTMYWQTRDGKPLWEKGKKEKDQKKKSADKRRRQESSSSSAILSPTKPPPNQRRR
jgi:hypothetical protein